MEKTSAAPTSTAPSTPTLPEFLEAARPVNPDATDAQLTTYYNQNYNQAPHGSLPTLVDFLEKARPVNKGVSDADLTAYWQSEYGDRGAREKPPEQPGVLGTAKDMLIKGAQGVVDLGQSAVGVGSLLTGGLIGKGMRGIGYDPAKTNEHLGSYLSEAQQESERAIHDAQGFVDTLIATAKNPRGTAGMITESLPGVFGMGAPARLLAESIAFKAAKPFGGLATEEGAAAAKQAIEDSAGKLTWASGASEGAQQAGSLADTAQAAGKDYKDYAIPAVLSGALDAAIVRGAGALVGDVNTALFTGAKKAGAQGSTPARILKSIFSEGVLEELPQSAQEQVFQNIAMDKPWHEGVENAAATGLVMGSIMGGAMSAVQGGAKSTATPVPDPSILKAGSVDEAVKAANESVDATPLSPDELDTFIQANAHTEVTRELDQQTLAKALEPHPEYNFDEQTAASTFKGAPVEAVDPASLPDSRSSDSRELTKDEYHVVSTLARAEGNRVILYADHPGLEDGFVNQAVTPGVIYLSKASGANPLAVLEHEQFHAMSDGFKAAVIDVIKETQSPEAVAIATQRHGAHLPEDKLWEEIGADIRGDAMLDPSFVGRVLGKMRESLGEEAAKSEALTFMGQIKSMIVRAKAVLSGVGKTFTLNGKRLAELYVTNLEKVHDVLATAIAKTYLAKGYRTEQVAKEAAKLEAERKRAKEPAPEPVKKKIPVIYNGIQEGFGDIKSFKLYTISEDIPGHPKDSTVSEHTLTTLGYEPVVTEPVKKATSGVDIKAAVEKIKLEREKRAAEVAVAKKEYLDKNVEDADLPAAQEAVDVAEQRLVETTSALKTAEADPALQTEIVEQQIAAVEAVLTPEDQKAAAQELGFPRWDESAAKEFLSQYAVWLQQGAKALGTVLSNLFSKVKHAAAAGVLALAVAVNFSASVAATPVPVMISPKMAPQIIKKAEANFVGFEASDDVKLTADWIVRNHKHEDAPFLIADKPGGFLYAMDAKGVLIAKASGLFGKQLGDTLSQEQQDKPLKDLSNEDKVTPAGVFKAKGNVSERYGDTLVLQESEGSKLALHRVYLGTRHEKRQERLQSDNPADKRISFGCINAPNEFIDDVITPHFKKGGVIVVLPDLQGAKSFFGIQASPKAHDVDEPESRTTLSTTVPTSKRSTDNSYTQNWIIGGEDVRASKSHVKALVTALRSYPMLSGKGTRDEVMQEFHATVVKNLLWLYDLVPEAIRARAKQWYVGANRIATEWAKEDGYTPRQHAGVLAVLSPQKDWFMNVSLADRVRTVMKDQADTRWSPAMTGWVEAYLAAATIDSTKESRELLLKDARRLEGQRLSDLANGDAARFVRVYDELTHERGYRLVTPEGGFGDYVTNGETVEDLFGTTPAARSSMAWGSFSELTKAVSILRDGSNKNIDRQLGTAHKVRNFYNNILEPNSAEGHVTIDTHAVAAALIKAVSGGSPEVLDNFGNAGSNNETGAQGTYGLLADAYREAAQKRKVLPREMQSVTWEAVRGLFPQSIKRALAPKIDAVWADVRKGKLSLESAREKIYLLSGGINKFAWQDGGVGLSPAHGGRSFDKETYGTTASTGSEGLRQPGVVRGSAGVLARERRPYSGAGKAGRTLRGLPTRIDVNGVEIEFAGFKPAQDAARHYMKTAGLPYEPEEVYHTLNPSRSRQIADAYERMIHAPGDPEVKKAYRAMIDETLAQYQAMLDTGLVVEFNDGTDPYGNPRLAMLDVVENNHLYVFSTRQGFGSNQKFDPALNPLLEETPFLFGDQPTLANDIFRAVHDYFGHVKEGNGFRAEGEDNAWYSHAAMYSDLARPAMTTETRGQNSWVNYGPHGEANRKASPKDTIYADQKTGLLPSFAMEKDLPQFSRKPTIPTELESRWEDVYDPGDTDPIYRENPNGPPQSWLIEEAKHVLHLLNSESVYTEMPEAEQRKLRREMERYLKAVDKPQFSPKQITLEHYSKQDNLTTIHPKHHGTGQPGAELKRKEREPESYVPRSYFYRAGTRPEARFKGQTKYKVQIDESKLADLSQIEGRTPTEREFNAKKAGYLGYHDPLGMNPEVVALFHPVKVAQPQFSNKVQVLTPFTPEGGPYVLLKASWNGDVKYSLWTADEKGNTKHFIGYMKAIHGTADGVEFTVERLLDASSFGAKRDETVIIPRDQLTTKQTTGSEKHVPWVIPISKKHAVDISGGVRELLPEQPQFSPKEELIQEAIKRVREREQYDLSPSKRESMRLALTRAQTLFDKRELSTNDYLNEIDRIIKGATIAHYEKVFATTPERVRGADYILERLGREQRHGTLSEEQVAFAKWLINGNEHLVADLGISVRKQIEGSVHATGSYNPITRVMNLVKENTKVDTAVHEILHHLERLMPAGLQNQIRVEWERQVVERMDTALGDEKKYLQAVLQANASHFKKDWEKALEFLHTGAVNVEKMYRFLNASEFFAVNGSEMLNGRFSAKLKQWFHEVVQRLRSLVGKTSDTPVIKALNWLTRQSVGGQMSNSMLTDKRGEFPSLERPRIDDSLQPMFSPKVWFSQLGNVLNEKMPAVASKEQVRNIITSGAVKQDEIKWTGVLDYLDRQKGEITKHNLLKWLANHDLQVEEVVKGGAAQADKADAPISLQEFNSRWVFADGQNSATHPDHEDLQIVGTQDGYDRYRIRLNEKYDLGISGHPVERDPKQPHFQFRTFSNAAEAAYEFLVAEPAREHEEEVDLHNAENDTKFEGYKLPGGEDYTELLLTLPGKPVERPYRVKKVGTGALPWRVYVQGEKEHHSSYPTEAAAKEFVTKYKSFKERGPTYTSPHFDEPNIVAHTRFTTRTDAAGRRVLFLEEVQSDWHEAGREKGYAKNTKGWTATSLPGGFLRYQIKDANGNDVTEIVGGTKESAIAKAAEGVPDAPFSKTWPELVMKRMLRWAAEHNYDALAWTTGTQQNERYSLSKHVAKIEVDELRSGLYDHSEYHVRAYRHVENIPMGQGATVINKTVAGEAGLTELLGKELTTKILEHTAKDGHAVLDGLDLEIGGSGMKYFYDQMLPRFMDKYLKRFGAKVEPTQIPFNGSNQMTIGDVIHPDVVHGITLTPEMKASVLGGQPQFSPAQEPYTVEQPGKLDKVIRVLQDKNIDIKRFVETLQAAGKRIPDELNPVLKEEVYQKRAEQRSKDFQTDELLPLTEAMRLRKITIAQLDEYAHARHVLKDGVNERLKEMNPDIEDNDALSGVSNAEAQAILAKYDTKIMDPLMTRLDAIVGKTRKLMVDYGLEKQATVDGWAETYTAYVPLRREGYEEEGHPTGTGRSVRGSTVKPRLGSQKGVEHILANLAQARDQVITKGEKNRVSTAMAGLIMLHPNKNIATLDKPAQIQITNPETGLQEVVPGDLMQYKVPRIRRYDPETGLVKSYPDPTYKGRSNVVNFRVKGVDYAIIFNDENERAMEMAKALKDADTGQLTGIMKAVAPYTRYLASVSTQYNPIFGIINFVRDTQSAMLTLSSTPIAGKQKELLSGALWALKGIFQDARAIRRGEHLSSPVAQLWQRFEHVGGPTGYRDLFFTSADRMKQLERMLNPTSWKSIRTPADLAYRISDSALFALLSDYNLAMENAIRLSAFKVALDSGLSDLQAASIGKNLTVNFNKKGQLGAQAGSLYAFFNANVQGTARIAETLFEKNGTLSAVGKKIVAGGILLGVLQTFLLAAAGFDDQDPPEYLKQKNLIVPMPGTDRGYIMLPLPLGFNLLPNVGRLAAEALWYGKPMQRGFSLMGAMIGTLSPTGGSGGIIQELAPTVADPIVALESNRDWTGKNISKEDLSSLKPTPGHTRARDTSTWWAGKMSHMINWATGGTEYTPGAFSPTPDAIDYLLQQVTGGVGREISKGAQVARGAVTGEETPLYKIPLVGRFAGSSTGPAAVREKFYDNVKQVNIAAEEIKGRRLHHEETALYMAEHPYARYESAVTATERTLSQLNKQKKDLIEKGASREAVKLKEEQMTALMSRLNSLIQPPAK